jgi:class 3 adenylate cyclase
MLNFISQLNQTNQLCRKYPLSLHAGAASGSYNIVTLGRPSLRLEFEIFSELTSTIYRCCELAKANELAVVLFANLFGEIPKADPDDSRTSTTSTEIFRTLFDIIDKRQGAVARVDPFLRGHKLLALFGALHKTENDSLNALHAAVESIETVPVGITIQIGLASGRLFCAEVGGVNRREYTVMGNAANSAARLMTKAAAGTVLMDESVFN